MQMQLYSIHLKLFFVKIHLSSSVTLYEGKNGSIKIIELFKVVFLAVKQCRTDRFLRGFFFCCSTTSWSIVRFWQQRDSMSKFRTKNYLMTLDIKGLSRLLILLNFLLIFKDPQISPIKWHSSRQAEELFYTQQKPWAGVWLWPHISVWSQVSPREY